MLKISTANVILVSYADFRFELFFFSGLQLLALGFFWCSYFSSTWTEIRLIFEHDYFI